MKLESNIIIPLTMEQIVERARAVLKAKETSYRLKYPNGGVDPRTPRPGMDFFDPATKSKLIVCDCAGFVAWCCGYSRKQTGTSNLVAFPDTPSVRGGWINTDSMIEESEGFKYANDRSTYPGGRWFKKLDVPKPGCIVVYHSRSDRYPRNPVIGHVGIVVAVPAEAYDVKDREKYFGQDTRNSKSPFRVIHCSGVDKTGGTAVRETSGLPWKGKRSSFLEFMGNNLLTMPRA